MREVAMQKIWEAGLSRIRSQMAGGWAILSGYQAHRTKRDNRARNDKLLGELRSKVRGATPLVGYWPDPETNEPAREESFFVQKPPDMPFEDFKAWILQLISKGKYDQEAALIGDGETSQVLNQGGSTSTFGKAMPTFGQLSAYYSRVKDRPFRFEGVLVPSGLAEAYGFEHTGRTGYLTLAEALEISEEDSCPES
jgi:hypothetical protein